MIKIIMGKKGCGKTQAFIGMVNKASEEAKGTVICITKGNKYKFDLKSTVRLVDTDEYKVDSYKSFYGFICGMLSKDYDITDIYIDSITKITDSDLEACSEFLSNIEFISEKFNVNFTIMVSADQSEATDEIKKFLIEY